MKEKRESFDSLVDRHLTYIRVAIRERAASLESVVRQAMSEAAQRGFKNHETKEKGDRRK